MTQARRFLIGIILVVVNACVATAQEPVPWHRQPHLNAAYNLSKTRILVVAAKEFNPAETVQMAECWKQWGAQVEFAGPERTLTGDTEGLPAGSNPPTLRVDYLLSEVDPSRYDVLFIAGGEGVADLLAQNREQLARLIDGVNGHGKIVSAICHGPMALSASTAVKGKRLTAQGEPQRQALEQAGAILLNEIAVVDGQLVTGQWPHMEAFAVTLAERIQFPSGGGPYEKMLAARTPLERAVDDLRNSYRFEPKPVPPDLLDRLARATQKACTPPAAPGCAAIKFVVVEKQSSKTRIADLLFEQGKKEFGARGMSEASLRSHLKVQVEQAPVLLLQFLDASQPAANDDATRVQRANFAYAGSASANMILVARSQGLGVFGLGVPVFLAAEPGIREVLQIPETAQLTGIFSVGYPTTSGTPAVARPLSEMLYYERWKGSRGGAPR